MYCLSFLFVFFTENVEDVSSNNENFIPINSVNIKYDSLVSIKDTLNFIQKN